MSAPTPPPPLGPITRSLHKIAELLQRDPKAAATDARAFLRRHPGQRQALALLVTAYRLAGDLAGARADLLEMAEAEPGLAAVQYQLGLLLIEAGQIENAIAALSRTVRMEPRHTQAWRALAEAHATSGNVAEANKACGKYIEFAAARLQQVERVAHGEPSGLPRAERILRARLARDPTDLSALVLLASVCIRLGRPADAKKPIGRMLELAPDFAPARNLAAL